MHMNASISLSIKLNIRLMLVGALSCMEEKDRNTEVDIT